MKWKARTTAVWLMLCLLLTGCHQSRPSPRHPSMDYDPLAHVRADHGPIVNIEATVPPQCYTRTGAESNPCWTCHTTAAGTNQKNDWRLQREYAFSPFARRNRWSNLFKDRTDFLARTSDAAILAWIRADNYTPLRHALARQPAYPGYVPDLDFQRGFDADGFARDGSGWRALRYKPFPGPFWPTNGSTDDVFIRLPVAFRQDEAGRISLPVYRLNLAVTEAAIAVPPDRQPFERRVEPVDEKIAGVDLDGDGRISSAVTAIRRLPALYF